MGLVKKKRPIVAVTSFSFSKKKELVEALRKTGSKFKLNLKSDTLSESKLIDMLSNAEVAIVGKEKITLSVLSACPNLKAICKYGVGLDNIDLPLLKKNKIRFYYEAGVNRLSVAEQTLGMMLTLVHRQYSMSLSLKKGEWKKASGHLLSGKTIGIIGVGNIGKELIRLLTPFHCKILVNDIIPQSSFYKKAKVEECSKLELYKKADMITIHTPLTSLTEKMISSKAFLKMKSSAILINTARGKIVDQLELLSFLEKNREACAGLDVFEKEPETNSALLEHPRIFCTPHCAGNSHEAQLAMGMSALKGLKKYLK